MRSRAVFRLTVLALMLADAAASGRGTQTEDASPAATTTTLSPRLVEYLEAVGRAEAHERDVQEYVTALAEAEQAQQEQTARFLRAVQHAEQVDDVEVSACRVGFFDFMEAVLEVTNNSSDPSTYFINVTFESPDGSRQFGTGAAFVSLLRNGQTTTVDASSIEAAPAGPFECRVAEVDRSAS